MSRPELKRAASSSPRTHDFSTSDPRSLFAVPNFLSDAQHQAQDREVIQKLKRFRQKRFFDPKDADDQGQVVCIVAQELGRNRGGYDLKPLLAPLDYADISIGGSPFDGYRGTFIDNILLPGCKKFRWVLLFTASAPVPSKMLS